MMFKKRFKKLSKRNDIIKKFEAKYIDETSESVKWGEVSYFMHKKKNVGIKKKIAFFASVLKWRGIINGEYCLECVGDRCGICHLILNTEHNNADCIKCSLFEVFGERCYKTKGFRSLEKESSVGKKYSELSDKSKKVCLKMYKEVSKLYLNSFKKQKEK